MYNNKMEPKTGLIFFLFPNNQEKLPFGNKKQIRKFCCSITMFRDFLKVLERSKIGEN